MKPGHVFRRPRLPLLCPNLQQWDGSASLGEIYVPSRESASALVHAQLGKSPAWSSGTVRQQAPAMKAFACRSHMEKADSEPRANEEKGEGNQGGGGAAGADTAASGGEHWRWSQHVPDTPVTRAKPIKFSSAIWQLPSHETSKRLPVLKVSVSIIGQVSAGTREADHMGAGGPDSSSQSPRAHLGAPANWAADQNPAAHR